MNVSIATDAPKLSVEQRVEALLEQMTLEEKIGQMTQANSPGGHLPDDFREAIKAGRIGSTLNEVDVSVVNEMQRVAVEESRLGIPLIVGRDVIHGFNTILPIPIGQAASFNPELVEAGAAVAAAEAARAGIDWTFAPMIDISRDARWGRIAESLGEDPYLASVLGAAMIRGFEGDDLSAPHTIAACAKHFAGYGDAESGRDYATTNIPENELRNVHLRPFKAAVDAGVSTLMASFSDLNGVPATGNEFLMRQVLRDEWGFEGFVVSDWASIYQLKIHGFTADDKGSAFEALNAGVDMEMATPLYMTHAAELVKEGKIPEDRIDTMVRNILKIKFELGLFERPYTDPDELPEFANKHALETARKAALQSVVLLKNDHGALPIKRDEIDSIAVIGPMANVPYEQLGTWVFDGDPELSVTPLEVLFELDGIQINHVRAMTTTRTRDTDEFDDAVKAARGSDVAVLFLGEESILSGEAHSRADISLPGNQAELVRRIKETGTPVIAVILAGRPLTLTNIVDEVDAILFAWHPGTMGGPAIVDLLFGVESPSGKLPATFPKMVGQIPIYYNQKNTGKPPSPETIVHIDEIDARAPQTSLGMTAFHLDAGYEPLFPFGHGLSYTEFHYDHLRVSKPEFSKDETLFVYVNLTNAGDVVAEEVAQLYVRDLVGNVTRPVRELKGFQRVRLAPGETRTLTFELTADDLAFYGRDNTLIVEPGDFHVWVGGSSETELHTEFQLVD
ncbi:MAG: glycoside hydrolase family 3 N-terminal domain-containing protein [Woeseiaceae bacterium]|nr:glycoside hydrolase family 3 N-terminal domain-containing protein [Woeseiaceae bacterium]